MSRQLTRIDLNKRETLATEVVRILLDHVFSGGFQPVGRLPSERQLAQTLGIGRTSVREALKSLDLLGLIEIRAGSGTYLTKPDSQVLPRLIEWGLLLGDQGVHDLVEARQHIEVASAGLAAQRRTKDDLAELRQRLHAMRRSKSPEEFVTADIKFHLKIAESSKNQVFFNLLSSIQSLLHFWISEVVPADDAFQSAYKEHTPVFEAIERQDSQAAVSTMSEHMEAAGARLRGALEHRDGFSPVKKGILTARGPSS